MDNKNTTQKNHDKSSKLREIDTTTWQRMSCMIRRRTDLTSNDKLVYTYMLNQYKHFSALQKDYHENMEDIANENGLGRKTVGDCVKRLSDLGLITIFKKSVHGSKIPVISYSYSINDEYNIFKPVQKKQSEVRPKAAKKFIPFIDDDEDNEPF